MAHCAAAACVASVLSLLFIRIMMMIMTTSGRHPLRSEGECLQSRAQKLLLWRPGVIF